MNIVFIVTDTLRRDRLGCYGSGDGLTPHIDALARDGAVFERYYAASFPTVPARADLHLGKWTFTFMGWEPLPRSETPVAAALSAAGYQTVGVVDTPFFVHDGFNYDRGFDHFYDLDSQHIGSSRATRSPLIPRFRRSEYDYAAPRTFALAEQCLERIYRKPFFLYVDTWDPHEPWDPPEWYVPDSAPQGLRRVDPPYGDWREAGLTEDDLATARRSYAGEIRMVDRWIGRLVERLASMGILEETAIVLTSDHGFYFGEHGLFGKMIRSTPVRAAGGAERATWGPDDRVWRRSPLYEEVAHVPLLVRLPGSAARRVGALASAVDVMPTILAMAQAGAPEGIHGRSLLPLLTGDADQGRPFVVTAMPLTNPGSPVRVVDDVLRRVVEFQPATITTPEWSLLYAAEGQPVELYDLETDPAQQRNVAVEHSDVVRELHARYAALLREAGTGADLLGPRSRL